MDTLKISLIAVAFLAGSVGPIAAAGPPAGRLLASQCFQCHGTNGQSQSDIPEINGMSANEMFQALREFKTSTETVMNQQAKVYTDAELRLIANYIATLPGGGD